MPVVPANYGGNGEPSSQSSTTGTGAGDGFGHMLKLLAVDAGHVGKNQAGNNNRKDAGLATENDDKSVIEKSHQTLLIGYLEQLLHNTQLEQPGQAFPYNITPGSRDLLGHWQLQSVNSSGLEQLAAHQAITSKTVELLQALALGDYSPANRFIGHPAGSVSGNAAPEITELLDQLRLQASDSNGFNQAATNTASNDTGVNLPKIANLAAMINNDDLSPEQLLRLLMAIKTSGKTAIPGSGTGVENQGQSMMMQRDDNASNPKGWQETQSNILQHDKNTINALDAAKKINTETSVSNALPESDTAYGRPGAEKQAVKVNLYAGMPFNRPVINVNGTNLPGALPGEVSRDGSTGHQQLELAQVGANLTSANANTARAAGHEAISFLRNTDTPLFAQLAEAVRGQVLQNGQGQTQIRLQLHPASLGEVNIKLTYQDGNITTHFHAATEQARQAIESSIQQLREALAGYHLNLQSVTVSAGDDGNRWGQQEKHGQQFKKRPGHIVNGPDNTGETNTAAGTEITQAGSINRLNYFA